MNILILGLLLLVAAAAILGAVFLSLSDQRASRASRAQASVPPPAAPAAEGRPPLVTRRLEDAAPAPASTTLPHLNEATNTLPYSPQAHDEEFAPLTLNGQFHELASEIRSLHQQATYLEQRLGVLTEMVGHIEQSTGAPSSERAPV